MEPPILKDKLGTPVRRFDIVKIFHFYGRVRGKGREKHYMHKIADVKDTPAGPQWFFWHSPLTFFLQEESGGYYPHFTRAKEEHTLKEAEIIDSTLGLKEKYPLSEDSKKPSELKLSTKHLERAVSRFGKELPEKTEVAVLIDEHGHNARVIGPDLNEETASLTEAGNVVATARSQPREDILELIARHDEATGFHSLPQPMRDGSVTYPEIIALGTHAISSILHYLKEKPGMNIQLLLQDITKTCPLPPKPVAPGFVGYDVNAHAKAWIAWGIANDYTTS
jgi:hypothetical protein